MQLENYSKDTPSKTRLVLNQDAASDIEFQYFELSCHSYLNIKKATACAMMTEVFGDGVLVYDKLMMEIPSSIPNWANENGLLVLRRKDAESDAVYQV